MLRSQSPIPDHVRVVEQFPKKMLTKGNLGKICATAKSAVIVESYEIDLVHTYKQARRTRSKLIQR